MKSRKSFLLRVEPQLYAELEAWAAAELRSVNGQIEYLLKQAVARRRRAELEPPATALLPGEQSTVPPDGMS